jgi:hypothetical protein
MTEPKNPLGDVLTAEPGVWEIDAENHSARRVAPSPLPCPFCGAPPEVETGYPRWVRVACGNRECLVGPQAEDYNSTREQLIKRWNTRAPTPKLDALIHALGCAVDAMMEIDLHDTSWRKDEPQQRLHAVEAAASELRTYTGE